MTQVTPTRRYINGGTQDIYKFPNSYGASVVNHSYSYGTELAVLHDFYMLNGVECFNLCYRTPITSDVLGWCSPEEIETALDAIEALPSEEDCEHRMWSLEFGHDEEWSI